MKWFVFFVFSSLIVFATTVYFRLGGYKSVQIEMIESEELILLGALHRGPYHKINDVIISVEKWAAENRWPCPRTYGEYFDDPRIKDEDRLTSEGGCVLPLIPSTDVTLPETIKIKKINRRPTVRATFKGAPSISPFKVYPAVEDFMLKNNLKREGAVIEVYDTPNQRMAKTEYLFFYSADSQ